MAEANLSPEKFEVLGPRLGSNFVVKFSGERQLATKRAASAMGALRKANGEWLDLRAVDADDKQIRLYVNTDKNGRMVRLEREGKKLQRAIQEGSPNAKVVFLRRDAVISFNFKAIAKIEVSPDGPTKLLWNEKALADSGVDRAEVTKQFTTNASEPVLDPALSLTPTFRRYKESQYASQAGTPVLSCTAILENVTLKPLPSKDYSGTPTWFASRKPTAISPLLFTSSPDAGPAWRGGTPRGFPVARVAAPSGTERHPSPPTATSPSWKSRADA
mgnify:CR=1 FL=1